MDKQDKKKQVGKEDEVEEVDGKGEIEKLQNRIEELEGQIKRTLADYQNLEKRVAGERREIVLSANKMLLLQLLPVLDTLMMVEKHLTDQGLTLAVKQFLDTLKTEGVEKIETLGKPFDPFFMECIETIAGEKNMVIEEVLAGYKLYDKVVRPARVKVGNGENRE